MTITAKVICFVKKPEKFVEDSTFEVRDEVLRTINPGEFIAEAYYFGVNAGLRAYLNFSPLNAIVTGGQVAKYKFIF